MNIRIKSFFSDNVSFMRKRITPLLQPPFCKSQGIMGIISKWLTTFHCCRDRRIRNEMLTTYGLQYERNCSLHRFIHSEEFLIAPYISTNFHCAGLYSVEYCVDGILQYYASFLIPTLWTNSEEVSKEAEILRVILGRLRKSQLRNNIIL